MSTPRLLWQAVRDWLRVEPEGETPDPEAAAAAAIAEGLPTRLAEAVGEFRTELDRHDAVGWGEAKRYTRDYLLDTWHPLPSEE